MSVNTQVPLLFWKHSIPDHSGLLLLLLFAIRLIEMYNTDIVMV